MTYVLKHQPKTSWFIATLEFDRVGRKMMMHSLWLFCFVALVHQCAASVIQYDITIHTGTERNAGTDSYVDITLHGDRGSQKLNRIDSNGDSLDNGGVDSFTFKASDVGQLQSIDVKLINRGWWSTDSWFADKIEITKSGGTRQEFICNSWIGTAPKTFYPKETSTKEDCGISMSPTSRIVGGNEASPGAWPWQVSIDYNAKVEGKRYWQGHWCGGSIINNRWIVSAAHCFHDEPDKIHYRITIGEHDLSYDEGYEQKIPIEKIVLHQSYNSKSSDYDIALIKLTSPMKFDKRAQPVCLPSKPVSKDSECYISGWGALNEGASGPDRLHQAKVPLVEQNTCSYQYRTMYNLKITNQMLCAGYTAGGIDSCQGDSGGPLVCKKDDRWHLTGAVSWGVGCAQPGVYGVYADIVVLRSWLMKNING